MEDNITKSVILDELGLLQMTDQSLGAVKMLFLCHASFKITLTSLSTRNLSILVLVVEDRNI